METIDVAQPPVPVAAGFAVIHQKVSLDISFSQQVQGKTAITIYPDSTSLTEIRLHSRQCHIRKVLVNGIAPSSVRNDDPCGQLTLHTNASVNQYHLLSEKISNSVAGEPEPTLIITLPKKLRIVPAHVADIHTQNHDLIRVPEGEVAGSSATEGAQGLPDTTVAKFTPLIVEIEFQSCHIREAVQFVSGRPGSGRWPHAYTRSRLGSGGASAIFPCVDRLNFRCTWDISIRFPRTVRDAIKQSLPDDSTNTGSNGQVKEAARQSYEAKEMMVVCSGELTDDIVDKSDNTKRTMSFSCDQRLAPEQLGLAIGPFERVNLSDLRDAQEVEELGRNAVEMLAYCLPGRAEETKNTCLPMTQVVDYVVRKYVSCPERSYSMCFVEDLHTDTSIHAGVTMCSTRMLYPENVIDSAKEVTRQLAHAIVSQWFGINIIAEEPRDNWVIIGAAYYITDLIMKDLCGNNEYRYHIRQQADLVYDLDHDRPSIYEMGALLHVDPSEYGFLTIKAPVVFFILDRRFAKVHGASKMPAILAKILTKSRMGDLADNALSTESFQKACERSHHMPIEDFMTQWVKGAGCPRFAAFQRFNKKKLVVEMLIKQTQGTSIESELDPNSFMRDAREDFHSVWAATAQPVFTGPMTIRIHEADGTPYEHTVEIKDAQTTFDIPYNTKYKRLKRSKKQRARANNKAAAEGPDDETDSLVYCLGDVLQGEEDVQNWRITEWSAEDDEKMNSESYEWIRLDADFEWICRINLQMPGYMFTSQLQQDRDVVAQLEALRQMSYYPPSSLISSIFIRTLMDRRYFHGVRTLAAQGLVKHAKDEGDAKMVGLYHLRKAFEEIYCTHDQGLAMTRPNDFSDPQAYLLQCEIIQAIASVRDSKGHTPKEVKDFLLDKLKFNDNSANDYSDAHYIAKLMKGLTFAVIARPQHQHIDEGDMDIDVEDEILELKHFERQFLEEIDRYRRMDEWTSSYQNLYSRTALECQALLTAAGIGEFSPLHFLQYTRPGNYDMLRRSAYEVLITPSIIEHPSILRYVLYCMVADPSPWIRQNLQHTFGKILGKRAIGVKTDKAAQAHSGDGLIIEDTTALIDDRQKEIARRSTIEGAIAALKKELGEDKSLRSALWNAISYDQITLEDLQILLDFCRLLYEPVDEMKIALHLPRYWKLEHQGKGKLKFSRTNKVRHKIVKKWQPAAASQPAKWQAPPLPTNGHSQYNVLPPPIRQNSITSLPSPGGGGGVKLKLKFGSSGGGLNNSAGSSQMSAHTPTPPPPPVRTPSAEPGRLVLKIKPVVKPKP